MCLHAQKGLHVQKHSLKEQDRQELPQNLKPYFQNENVTLYHGDAMDIMPQLPTGIADAAITDPPYCSGGQTVSGRSLDPSKKYCQGGRTLGRPSFDGDVRDQRGFAFWVTMWLRELRSIVKPAGYCLTFTDWRQLPIMADALQAAGFTYRGIIAWNKGRSARAPHKGYFRHQCEYITWGTNGKCEKAKHAGPYDGCITQPVLQKDKHHMTGKPTPLMRQLIEAVEPNGLIIDPFAGSSTTGVAALQTGRRAILIEQSEEYCEISAKRLEAAIAENNGA